MHKNEHGKNISFRIPSWMKRENKRSLLSTQINGMTDFIAAVNDRATLDEQVQVQAVFQRIIHDLQHPKNCYTSRCYRYHRYDPDEVLDGFALEFQELARHLQTAIAAHRTLEVPMAWTSAYAPPDCQWKMKANAVYENRKEVPGDFLCLWKPPSNCTEYNMEKVNKQRRRVKNPLPSGSAIVSGTSRFFDTRHYGSQRMVDWVFDDSWYELSPHVDVLHHWEQTMGRFWVRAQMAHYLWRPSEGLLREIDARAPAELMTGDNKFIGMHIRKTDNRDNFKSDFGRDAEITRGTSRFFGIASQIRNEFPTIHTIFLATDNDDVVREAFRMAAEGQWNLIIQEDVERSTSKQFMWFRESRRSGAASIATDIEVLRRADFLIGSHQSNVYRLATELNTAWNVGKYPRRLNRLRTVDIPWYEHP